MSETELLDKKTIDTDIPPGQGPRAWGYVLRNGVTARALFDSGAQLTIMNRGFFHHVLERYTLEKVQYDRKAKITLRYADNATGTEYGRAKLAVTIGDKT